VSASGAVEGRAGGRGRRRRRSNLCADGLPRFARSTSPTSRAWPRGPGKACRHERLGAAPERNHQSAVKLGKSQRSDAVAGRRRRAHSGRAGAFVMDARSDSAAAHRAGWSGSSQTPCGNGDRALLRVVSRPAFHGSNSPGLRRRAFIEVCALPGAKVTMSRRPVRDNGHDRSALRAEDLRAFRRCTVQRSSTVSIGCDGQAHLECHGGAYGRGAPDAGPLSSLALSARKPAPSFRSAHMSWSRLPVAAPIDRRSVSALRS